jgi:hypothetical protein
MITVSCQVDHESASLCKFSNNYSFVKVKNTFVLESLPAHYMMRGSAFHEGYTMYPRH